MQPDNANLDPAKDKLLVEGIDFYIENGFCVFTTAYHLKRGYCCGSGCRHCAWKDQPKGKTES